jgi:hypothetical protein
MKSSNLSERRLGKSYFKHRKERYEAGVAALDSRGWAGIKRCRGWVRERVLVTRVIAGVELEESAANSRGKKSKSVLPMRSSGDCRPMARATVVLQ